MSKYFKNDGIEILRFENNTFIIKLLKKIPSKKTLNEYHEKVLAIYKEHNRFNLIFHLKELCIWSACIVDQELKFLNKLLDKSEQVKSVAIISTKGMEKILKFFIKKFEMLIPYIFSNNLEEALTFTKEHDVSYTNEQIEQIDLSQ